MLPNAKASRFLRLLILFVFFLSGFASLLYQVAWQRLLTVNYGVGSLSIVLIVSVYMFGLGIGGYIGGMLAERIKNKVLFYFFIELLIGLFGVISLPLLDFLQRYTAGSSYLLSFVYIFAFLCLPTILMGATLPLLTKIYNALISDFFETVSSLYFINTIGAAAGALCASYGIISFFGLDTAVYTAVGINLLLAGLIFFVKERYQPAETPAAPELAAVDAKTALLRKYVYPIVFLTGFLAIGYEVVWFRVVSVLVKDSPYAFSTTLFVYLLGIALGSWGIRRYLRKRKVNKANLFLGFQFLIGLFVAIFFIAFVYLNNRTPLEQLITFTVKTSIIPEVKSPQGLGDWVRLTAIVLWPLVFFFIPVLLMGASFPLISDIAYTRSGQEAKTVGVVYFFNILGNVLGGIVTGFLLLPLLKTSVTLLVFTTLGLSFGFFIDRFRKRNVPVVARVAGIAALLLTVILVFPGNEKIYTAVHRRPWGFNPNNAPIIEEGKEGVVCTYTSNDSLRCFINGSSHGGRPEYYFYVETIEALSYAGKRDRVLVIGLGTGTMLEGILRDTSVKEVVLVEVNRVLIDNLGQLQLYKDMFADPRLSIIIDDGRRLLYQNTQPFDLILMDPLRTRTAYSNNIYSKEFFELCRKHLSPQGLQMTWYDEVQVLPNTIASAYPRVRCYHNFALASENVLQVDSAHYKNLLLAYDEKERAGIQRSQASYLGSESFVKEKYGHLPVNRDWKPVTEYYLGSLAKGITVYK